MYNIRKSEGKFNFNKMIRKGVLTSDAITERRTQNIVVAIYEGVIREELDCDASDELNTVFGRSIYCNFEQSYFLGYTNGQERHSKGILYKNNKVMS